MEFISLSAQQERIKSQLDAAIQRVMAHGKYILGPEVDELEVKLSEYCGAEFCITCGNGTDALQIALMALDLKPGDEIITPAFTYIATAEAAAVLGLKPVYVDINPSTFNIDVQSLERHITSKTGAIVVVSLFGQCADMDEINAIANRYELPVIEDAAQSFGARYKERKSCNLSTLATTSFFPAKPLGCYGDGGAIFTSDHSLSKKVRQIARHGQINPYDHQVLGINSRLDTLQAAILLQKLLIFDAELEAREKAAFYYNQLIDEKLDGSLTCPVTPSFAVSAWAQYTVSHPERDKIIEKLRLAGIPTAVYYPKPLNKQKAVADLGAAVPNSELASNKVFSLPMHPYLTRFEQEKIVDELQKACRK